MAARSRKRGRARKTRVLVVDDHPILREGLEQLISREPDMMYCGGVGTAAEALKAAATQKPDVVISGAAVSIKALTFRRPLMAAETIKDDCAAAQWISP